MLPSLEQIWGGYLRTSSALLLANHYVEFIMIAINLEWGENTFVYILVL